MPNTDLREMRVYVAAPPRVYNYMLVEYLSTYTCSRMLQFCIPYVIGGSWVR